ncbi:MAG: hypothetical protein FWC16_03885 [Defluviitaleaceae bacterium]|nr:hypothetical protein [Defluviitaleaceae bacterium]MCL2274045.1 hypothetical protein [Defluviitaleaceae bacterium]
MDKISLEVLKKLIKNSGLKYYQIADGICDASNFSNMLNGKRSMSHDVYVKIMNKLGLSYRDFAGATTEEDADAIQRRNKLKHLLRQIDAPSHEEARKIIDELEKTSYFSQGEGLQMLLGHKATLAGYNGQWEQMKKYVLQGLNVTRLQDGKSFDETKIATYALSIEEVKLVNQLAIAYASTPQETCTTSNKSPLEKSTGIFVDLHTALTNKPYHDEELANIHIAMLCNLTKSLGLLNRHDDKLPYCDTGIALCRRHRNAHCEPILMINKSWALLQLKKEKDGKELLRKACAIFEATDRHEELDAIKAAAMEEFGITVSF